MKPLFVAAAVFAGVLGATSARAQATSESEIDRPAARSGDVVITVDPCRKRMRRGCWTAAQISRYGAAHYWEVVYAVVGDKWILAQESDYGATLDDACGKTGLRYLKSIAPVVERRVPEVLAAAQDIKEQCELDRIRADGLAAVNTALNIRARDLSDFRVFRIAKEDLKTAPAAAQDMLAPWVEASR